MPMNPDPRIQLKTGSGNELVMTLYCTTIQLCMTVTSFLSAKYFNTLLRTCFVLINFCVPVTNAADD